VAIDERSRHALYLRLEHVLGRDEAETLMEHLPPVGWADVATRRDLDILRTELRAMEQSLTGLFRMELAQAVTAQTRTMAITMITLFVTGVSLAFAAARLG
jgi:hypothetical protein